MSIGELFDGTVERAAGLTADRHLVFDWELVESAWTGAGHPERDREARGGLRRRPVADGRPLEPRSVARRLAPGRPDPGRRPRCRGAGRGGAAADHARDAVPVLRRGARAARRAHPGDGVGRPAGRATSDRTSRGGTARAAGRRCPGRRVPGAGFTTGRPWLRFGPDADTRNVAAQAADPSSVLSLYRRLIALRATSQALQVGTLRLDPDATGRSRRLHERGRRAGRRGRLQPRPEPGLVAAPGRVARTGPGGRSSGRRPIRRRARRSPVAIAARPRARRGAACFERIG